MRTDCSARLSRTLHLIDADNLLGDPTTVDRRYIGATFDEHRRVARYVEDDHAEVATGINKWHVLEVERAWPKACHRRPRGRDGADLALLEDASWAAASRRFERVVIGSGDGIFVVAFDALVAAGVAVEVVSLRAALSRVLALRARGCVRTMRATPTS